MLYIYNILCYIYNMYTYIWTYWYKTLVEFFWSCLQTHPIPTGPKRLSGWTTVNTWVVCEPSAWVDLQVYQQKYGEISKTGIKQLEMGQSYIEYHCITISPKMDMLDMLDSWKCPIVLDMLITVILWVCVVLLIHHEFDPSPPKNMAKTNLGESLPLKRKAQRVVRLPIF